jgi:hypothetical protein
LRVKLFGRVDGKRLKEGALKKIVETSKEKKIEVEVLQRRTEKASVFGRKISQRGD